MIINESQKELNASYASYILSNKGLLKRGLSLDGARLINSLDNEFNMLFVSSILTNKKLLESE